MSSGKNISCAAAWPPRGRDTAVRGVRPIIRRVQQAAGWPLARSKSASGDAIYRVISEWMFASQMSPATLDGSFLLRRAQRPWRTARRWESHQLITSAALLLPALQASRASSSAQDAPKVTLRVGARAAGRLDGPNSLLLSRRPAYHISIVVHALKSTSALRIAVRSEYAKTSAAAIATCENVSGASPNGCQGAGGDSTTGSYVCMELSERCNCSMFIVYVAVGWCRRSRRFPRRRPRLPGHVWQWRAHFFSRAMLTKSSTDDQDVIRISLS